ncbi:MAG: hypothetical protein M3168_03625 [Actinomycetota bacterium]|nr:hypothetical protein [Actinomycetota bacterium]
MEELEARIRSLVGERQTLRAGAAPRERLESNRREICRLQQQLSLALIQKFQPAA